VCLVFVAAVSLSIVVVVVAVDVCLVAVVGAEMQAVYTIGP